MRIWLRCNGIYQDTKGSVANHVIVCLEIRERHPFFQWKDGQSLIIWDGLGRLQAGSIHFTHSGWWLSHPSETYESQMGVLFPIYGTIKHVPNLKNDDRLRFSRNYSNPRNR
jgi:hypothetical protein